MSGGTERPGSSGPGPGNSGSRPGRAIRMVRLVLGGTAAFLVFVMMLITVVDVAGRYLFSAPLPGAFEFTEIALAIVIFLGLPIVCFDNGHIAVSLITDRLRGILERLQSACAAFVGAGTLGLVCWRLFEHGAQLSSYGDITIFLGIPKGPIAYFLSLMTGISALYLLTRGVRILARRDASDLNTIVGRTGGD